MPSRLPPPFAGDSDPLVSLVARITVLGGLPHSEPSDNEFHRSFGTFRLSLSAPKGLPYGRIPRLILSHITTLAVRTGSPDIVLASSIRSFCDCLGMPATGGPNGYIAQIRKQLLRLVDLNVKATWEDRSGDRDPEEARIYAGYGYRLCSAYYFPWLLSGQGGSLPSPVFDPRSERSAGANSLRFRLSEESFRLITHKPVPVNFDTLKQLQSPMAMDIYVYCTWRALRALRRGRPEAVPWEELRRQLGADYGRLRDFRSRFLSHLETVLHHYPAIRVQATSTSLVVYSYQPHIGLKGR